MAFSLLAVLVSYLVAEQVFERMPHLEDEMAYVWQAQAIAGGHLNVPSPPQPKSFLVPFVIDYQGQRFGKYPLGWPVILAIGIWLGQRALVNPLLAGMGVWLTYRLGKMILSPAVGILAAGLTLVSPFFWMNSGSLLSHPFGLVLSAAFAIAWLDAFTRLYLPRRWLPTLVAALCLGMMVLTRPMTAAGIALPFGLHAAYLFLRGHSQPEIRRSLRRRLLALAGMVAGLSLLHFAWQWAVTGDPLLNPYTLWWSYDRVGFGPGVGRIEGGHSLHQAWINTRHSLQGNFIDLFGWGSFSFLFIPFGVLAGWRKPAIWWVGLVFPALVLVYMAYWIGSQLFGPRYYYEGLYSLTLLSAAGIAYLGGWPVTPEAPPPPGGTAHWRRRLTILLVTILVGYNLSTYLPYRLHGMQGLYEVHRSYLQPFLLPDAQKLTPALIVVYPRAKWTEYGALLELSNPYLDTPFIFVHTDGPAADAAVVKHFPQRHIFYYDPGKPYSFSASPPAR